MESKEDLQAQASKFVDATTATRMLGVSRSHIYKLIDRKIITPYEMGLFRVYSRAEIERRAAARAEWIGR